MEMQMTTVAIFSWGSGLEAGSIEYSMYYPIKTFSTATVCLFHAYLLTFPCFFGDAIEDIYNKYTSLSIYQKKNLFTSVRGLQCPTAIYRSIAATRVHYD